MAGVGVATAVAVAATVASTAAGVAGQMGAFGGKSSGGGAASNPQFKPVPRAPDDQAMRDIGARMLLQNANAQYPGFADYSRSGGDPSKAQFPLSLPSLSPQDMTALGFTGKQGQAIPGTPMEQAAAAGATGLSPQQSIFLGKQRSNQAQQAGGPGNATPLQQLGQVSNKLDKVQNRLTGMGPDELTTGPGAAGRPGRIQDRLDTRVANLQRRQQNLLTKVGQR